MHITTYICTLQHTYVHYIHTYAHYNTPVDFLQPSIQKLEQRVDGVLGGKVFRRPGQVEDVLLQIVAQLEFFIRSI
jgi:hypothetical protein